MDKNVGSSIDQRIMAELAPPELTGPNKLWKQRQSVATKLKILEAVVACLAKLGYSKTNQLVVSDRSGVSRGGIQHHYPIYMDMIASAADYAFFRRCKMAADDLRSASSDEGEQLYLDVAWKTMVTVEYEAYLELLAAARTDGDLRAMLAPKATRYYETWRELIFNLHPEWRRKSERFQLANDFLRSFYDGYRLNINIFEDPDRAHALQELLASLLSVIWGNND